MTIDKNCLDAKKNVVKKMFYLPKLVCPVSSSILGFFDKLLDEFNSPFPKRI